MGAIRGWRLFALIAALLTLMAVVVLALDPAIEGLRRLIRCTARTSVILFLASYTAAAAARLWPGAATRWQLGNRRYLGLSFAFSHALHLAGLVAFRALAPREFGEAAGPAQFVFGGVAYAFIAAMTLTSFEPAARAVGRRAWAVLHTAGVHYLWAIFTLTFTLNALADAAYWPAVAVMAGALALRLAARRRIGSASTAAAR